MCTSKYEHTERLLSSLRETNLRYHNHKETMAYAAFAAFMAAFGAGLVSKDWPPAWVFPDLFWQRVATGIGVTILFVIALIFVRWQLRNRRWSSIRDEGLEFLLFTWLTRPPNDDDLALYKYAEPPKERLCNTQRFFRALKNFGLSLKDLFWPFKKVYSRASRETRENRSALNRNNALKQASRGCWDGIMVFKGF